MKLISLKQNKCKADDSMHTLHTLEKDKGLQYEPHMARLRNVTVVHSGLRAVTYRTCSFTSLGALGSGMSKCINGAASFLKKRELLADVPRARADGLSPAGGWPFSVSGKMLYSGCYHVWQCCHCTICWTLGMLQGAI